MIESPGIPVAMTNRSPLSIVLPSIAKRTGTVQDVARESRSPTLRHRAETKYVDVGKHFLAYSRDAAESCLLDEPGQLEFHLRNQRLERSD